MVWDVISKKVYPTFSILLVKFHKNKWPKGNANWRTVYCKCYCELKNTLFLKLVIKQPSYDYIVWKTTLNVQFVHDSCSNETWADCNIEPGLFLLKKIIDLLLYCQFWISGIFKLKMIFATICSSINILKLLLGVFLFDHKSLKILNVSRYDLSLKCV